MFDGRVEELFREGKRPPKLRFPENLSHDAQGLFKKLLKVNPEDRVSMKSALQLPWIQNYANNEA